MLASFHNGEGWAGSGARVHLVGLGASVCRDGPGTWVCMCQPVPWVHMGQPGDLGGILAPGSKGTNLVLGPVFGFAGAVWRLAWHYGQIITWVLGLTLEVWSVRAGMMLE